MEKPTKPYPDFPLTINGNGQYSKKIHGKVHYFGSWAGGWQAALEKFNREKVPLYAGQTPPDDAVQVRDILNAFRRSKEAQRDHGDLSPRTFDEYEAVTDTIADTLGRSRPIESIVAADLERLRAALIKAKSGGVIAATSQKRKLAYAKAVFRYANEELGCDVRYRKVLAPPPAKQLRKAKREAGIRAFESADIHALLARAKPQMKAMIYLGINCGFANRDCATLMVGNVSNGWVDHPRPKTEVDRRCPLWPETKNAIRDVIGDRQEGYVFVTRYGNPWFDDGGGRCPISAEFRKLADDVGVKGSFSWLRKTFETVAQSQHPVAVNYIMGHADNSMAAVYRQRVYDDQLHIVTDHVRQWLNNGRQGAAGSSSDGA